VYFYAILTFQIRDFPLFTRVPSYSEKFGSSKQAEYSESLRVESYVVQK